MVIGGQMDIFQLAEKRKLSKCESVTVEGEEFFVKRLDAGERDIMEEQWLAFKEMRGSRIGGIRGFTVAFSLCDSQGNRTYDSGTTRRPEQTFVDVVERLMSTPLEFINPLWNKSASINKMTQEDVEELEKN